MTDQNPLPTWCTDDHWCPMEAAAAVLGRKWHPVIVYHLLEEQPLRFSELEDRMHTVSGKVLSESLEDLEEKGLVNRTVADDRPVKVEYRLTDHGERLEPVIRELTQWGEQCLEAADSPTESVV
ncbi:transcriptional regulator [Halobacteriales archaeon QH_6_66_25]|nr:MAG: transcriptional regulator [Halobacteriales archaeon QH_6_66_25]